MEEAYDELYQQFLRLQSLCLRQAALLHQLTSALQKQQGAAAPYEDPRFLSIPVQCVQEVPPCFQGIPTALWPPPLPGPALNLRDSGTFSEFLAQDMCKLSMNSPHLREDDAKANQRPTYSSQPALGDDPEGGRTLHGMRMPVMDAQLLGANFGGLLMSDVALHSHVCDFCQAVFPGDTTTRGEFLRHLDTHIP